MWKINCPLLQVHFIIHKQTVCALQTYIVSPMPHVTRTYFIDFICLKFEVMLRLSMVCNEIVKTCFGAHINGRNGLCVIQYEI